MIRVRIERVPDAGGEAELLHEVHLRELPGSRHQGTRTVDVLVSRGRPLTDRGSAWRFGVLPGRPTDESVLVTLRAALHTIRLTPWRP